MRLHIVDGITVPCRIVSGRCAHLGPHYYSMADVVRALAEREIEHEFAELAEDMYGGLTAQELVRLINLSQGIDN